MSVRFCSTAEVHRRSLWLLGRQFRVSVERCTDERENNTGERMGLPEGLAEMYCSGGGRDNTFASAVYKERVTHANRRYRRTNIRNGLLDIAHPMAEIRFVVVHHSGSDAECNSCAAWGHHTQNALDHMGIHVHELNNAFRGSMVAILTKVDTDTDAFTIYGPRGRLSVIDYIKVDQNGELRTRLLADIRRVFPDTWGSLTSLERPEWRLAFYEELAERLEANIAHVRQVLQTQRPIEQRTYSARMLFIGRPLEVQGRDVFCIEDREPAVMANLFGIGLPLVTANLIKDAIQKGKTEWETPVIIGIPHDPTRESRAIEATYAARIWYGDNLNVPGLLRLAANRKKELAIVTRRILKEERVTLPRTINRGLDLKIFSSLRPCICVSDRRTRLLVPV